MFKREFLYFQDKLFIVKRIIREEIVALRNKIQQDN